MMVKNMEMTYRYNKLLASKYDCVVSNTSIRYQIKEMVELELS